MTSEAHGLGGRLALADRDDLDSDAQQAMDELLASQRPWAEQVGFAATDDEGHLIGPFNALLLDPAMSEPFMTWQRAEEKNSSLSPRARQVVILAVGAVWQSPYELYCHSAVARQAGLSEEETAGLRAGALPTSLTADESVAARAARAITLDRSLDDALYAETVSELGERGLFDLLNLAGAYHFVCAVLNAFKVPAPT